MELLPGNRLARAGLLAIVTLVLVAPPVVMAHAELDTATPADGATVEGSPPEVSGTFTQDMKVDGSSLELRDADGRTIAKGGVDPDDPRRMAIEDLPVLAPGAYEVRWTTLSAEDDETARDQWSFTVVAAPTATPVATGTPAPTATPAATATAATSATPPSVPPSAATSAAPSASPVVAPSPAPSGATGDPAASTSDVLVPILAGLAIVVVVAVVLLRRRGPSTPPA